MQIDSFPNLKGIAVCEQVFLPYCFSCNSFSRRLHRPTLDLYLFTVYLIFIYLFVWFSGKNLFLLGMKKIRMDRFSFFSIIKAIIEASPDLVSERDTSGNTALHVAMYKTPLMGLLLLKSKDVDLNATNDAGQTPLHIYTHKVKILTFDPGKSFTVSHLSFRSARKHFVGRNWFDDYTVILLL